MNATELGRVSFPGRGGAKPANATELFFRSKTEANDGFVGVCIGVSFIVALSGLSAADVSLSSEVPFSGTVILDNFFEKFLDVLLAKLVPVPPIGNCSVRDVVFRIPGLFAKGFVEVKKGFAFSTAPPAA